MRLCKRAPVSQCICVNVCAKQITQAHEPLSLTKDSNCAKSLHRTIHTGITQTTAESINGEASRGKKVCWPENVEHVQMISSACFTCLFYQYSYERSTLRLLLLRICAPLVAAILVHPLPMKSRKVLVCDIVDAGLDYDVSGTGCWAQHGSTHGRDFMTSSCETFNKQG